MKMANKLFSTKRKFASFLFLTISLFSSFAFGNDAIKSADASVFNIFTQYANGDEGRGTGFLVTNDGLVATNNHVIENTNEIVVIRKVPNKKPQIIKGKVVFRSKGLDFSLVKFDGLTGNPLRISSKYPVKGDKVFAIGYPEAANIAINRREDIESALESTITEGIVGRVFDGSWPRGGAPMKIVQHSAAISPGNSGGPLLDQCGYVVGINTMVPLAEVRANSGAIVQKQGVFFASSIVEMIPELQANGVSPPESNVADKCVGLTASTQGAKGALGGVWHYLIIVLAAVSILLIVFALYFFTKKPQVVTESYTHYMKRSKGSIEPRQSRSSVRLENRTAAGKRSNFDISPEAICVIGRDPSLCQLVVDDSSVSRKHAQVRNVKGTLQIRDLGSTNGTFVNGKKIGETFCDITSSDQIRLGKTTLKIL